MREFVLAKQVLKSGTSIGANVEEAAGAQSRLDFISKLNIAYKEGRETKYWLRLLYDGGFIEEQRFNEIMNECIELNRILARIILSTKNNENSAK